MTRNEKKKLINHINFTICCCYKELILMPRYSGYENDFKSIGLDISRTRNELVRISSDLDCDSTPDYKLNAYSARTVTLLANILDAKMTFQDQDIANY